MYRAAVMGRYVKIRIFGCVGTQIWGWPNTLCKLAYYVGVWNCSVIQSEIPRKTALVLSIPPVVLTPWKTRP
ncbi:hypothetical protein D915_011121 [Fasciola hepatica]|uniref:Uncharacterized protein n=1 Tax=Fasciola hepatica TaxID=6192 RepID=A0A4E0QTF6_FASHE|nr:hypothetical protein D915_011121 [Fasciola hepatica]